MRIRVGRVLAWLGVGLLVACAVALMAWRMHGGRWVRVETASMGTQAPVGTLLWVAPASFGDLRPGDLITFHPPGSRATYSHLVKSLNADGTISTQGKITAPDPWRIGPRDVVGKVVWEWRGVGWVLVAAPVLAGGGLLVAAVAARVRDRCLRLPVALVGGAAVLALALVVYRPLTRAEQLSFEPIGGGARATYVSTGLLPMRLTASGGDTVLLHDGETGSVVSTGTGTRHRRYTVSVRPEIPWTWWLGLVGICFVPVLLRPRRHSPETARRTLHRAAHRLA